MSEVKMPILEPKITPETIKEQIDAAKERVTKLKESLEQSGDAPYDESEEEEQPSEKPMDTTTGESDGDEENSDSDTTSKSETQEEKPVTSDECPACHCRKRKKTGGFPFGRDPAEASMQPKKPKEDPKTPWGKFQRQYADKFKDLNSSQVTTAIARVYYVPVHANGTKTPKSLERMLRETHQFIQPWAKSQPDEERAKSLRQWVEGLLHNAIVNHHISTHTQPPKDDKNSDKQ